jgi:hypothetical protein
VVFFLAFVTAIQFSPIAPIVLSFTDQESHPCDIKYRGMVSNISNNSNLIQVELISQNQLFLVNLPYKSNVQVNDSVHIYIENVEEIVGQGHPFMITLGQMAMRFGTGNLRYHMMDIL